MIITDIKHMDSVKHKEYTGVGNELTLSNIVETVKSGKPLIIRIPVVPDHNNDEENINATAKFIIDKLENRVMQVQLLPYRQLGTEKYKSLGQDYPMDYLTPPERSVWEKNIIHIADLMKSYGVLAVAGTNVKTSSI
jgi:pyruvate formate lyase activating enzyme